MSLQAVAEHLQTKGRGNDTMLIHMTPNEVSGLQTLAMKHGGSLTINPDTGLPEAGFLDSILPVVAGVVGAKFGISPFLMAGGVGMATALATGDLGRGLTAGLGAYGGAGLGDALKAAGTNAVQNAAVTGGDMATATLMDQKANMAQALTNPAMASPAMASTAQSIGPNGLMGGANLFGATNAAPQIGQQASQVLASQAAPAAKGAFTQQLTQQTPWDQMKQGFNNITSSPKAAMNFITENPMTVAGAALPILTNAFEPQGYKPMEVEKGNEVTYQFNQGYNPKGPRYFNPSYGTPTIRRLKDGGIANLAGGGRLLSGEGDGVSDSIPATIEGRQPARLADGEFVLPARIVSEIGNGSTKAGANKLYDMMERIQANRRKTIGKGKVAVDSGAERYLPA